MRAEVPDKWLLSAIHKALVDAISSTRDTHTMAAEQAQKIMDKHFVLSPEPPYPPGTGDDMRDGYAFGDGRNAHRQGKLRHAAPAGAERGPWLRGWDDRASEVMAKAGGQDQTAFEYLASTSDPLKWEDTREARMAMLMRHREFLVSVLALLTTERALRFEALVAYHQLWKIAAEDTSEGNASWVHTMQPDGVWDALRAYGIDQPKGE